MINKTTGTTAIIAASVAIFWPGVFVFGIPGVMATYWKEIFDVGRGAIGNVMFFVLASLGIFMFFVGHWQEKFGQRLMVLIGSVLTGLSPVIIVVAGNIYMLYFWAFTVGTASCFIYIPVLTTVQKWYPTKRGLVSGIVNLTFGISAAIMAPVLGFMLERIGYAPMLSVLGAAALITGVPAALLTSAPETLSLAQSGASPGILSDPSLSAGQSIRTTSFWFLWLTWALQGSAGIAMITLSTAFGLSRGFPLESAVLILTAFNLTNGLSRFISGLLSDIIGRNLTMSLTFLAAAGAYFTMPFATTLSTAAIFAAVIGFAFGTLFAVSAPLVTDCFGIKHFGAILGLIFTAYGFVAGAIGPSLSGYLLDMTNGNFAIVFSYLGTFCLVSGIVIHYVRPPKLKAQ